MLARLCFLLIEEGEISIELTLTMAKCWETMRSDFLETSKLIQVVAAGTWSLSACLKPNAISNVPNCAYKLQVSDGNIMRLLKLPSSRLYIDTKFHRK